MLERAIEVATAAHAGQDYDGQPYTLHLVGVASQLRGDLLQTIAWLHDVVEDTPLSLADLAEFGPVVCSALAVLTRGDGEFYAAYIERVATNPFAAEVKCADLFFNLSRTDAAHLSLRKRYMKAAAYLVPIVLAIASPNEAEKERR